jgi:hypothetical protein
MRVLIFLTLFVVGGGQALQVEALDDPTSVTSTLTSEDPLVARALRVRTAQERQKTREDALRSIPHLDEIDVSGHGTPLRMQGDLGLTLSGRMDQADLTALSVWMTPIWGLNRPGFSRHSAVVV